MGRPAPAGSSPDACLAQGRTEHFTRDRAHEILGFGDLIAAYFHGELVAKTQCLNIALPGSERAPDISPDRVLLDAPSIGIETTKGALRRGAPVERSQLRPFPRRREVLQLVRSMEVDLAQAQLTVCGSPVAATGSTIAVL